MVTENKTILIIEGIDCSGKDYFISKLSKELCNSITIKNNFKPRNYEEREIIKNKYKAIIAIAKKLASFDFIILNRFYPSELVYSAVKRSYDANKDIWYKFFENSIKRMTWESNIKVILVYVYESPEEIKKRMKERGEDYIIDKDVDNIIKAYDNFYKKTKLTKIKIKSSEIYKLVSMLKNG
jgi:thymidylate kinase